MATVLSTSAPKWMVHSDAMGTTTESKRTVYKMASINTAEFNADMALHFHYYDSPTSFRDIPPLLLHITIHTHHHDDHNHMYKYYQLSGTPAAVTPYSDPHTTPVPRYPTPPLYATHPHRPQSDRTHYHTYTVLPALHTSRPFKVLGVTAPLLSESLDRLGWET